MATDPIARRPVLILALGVAVWACARPDAASVEETETGEGAVLEGRWRTTGTDARYGAAEVDLQIDPAGDLVVTVHLSSGATLEFPGTWVVEGDVLLLSGTYFGSDGQTRVLWSMEADSVMVLQSQEGDRQRWRRSG